MGMENAEQGTATSASATGCPEASATGSEAVPTSQTTSQVTSQATSQATLQPAAHGKGICEALYLSADGRLLTTGADGRLACQETQKGQKDEGLGIPASSTSMSRSWAQKISHSLRVTAAAVSSDARMLAVAEETSAGFQAWVHLLDSKGRVVHDQKPRIAGRFTLDIRHLSWHSSLPYLCIATDDGKVDLWFEATSSTATGSSAPGSSRKQVFKGGGSSGGVRCAFLDHKAERIAAAFSSGELVVLDVSDVSSTEQYRAKIWNKCVGSERLLMAWDPSGDYLALPGHMSVRLLPRDFSKEMVQLEGGHRFSTTMTSWSPSGHVLVSACAEAVAVWTQHRLCRVIRFTVEPSSIVWGGCDFIAVGTQAGHFAHLQVLDQGQEGKEREKGSETQDTPTNDHEIKTADVSRADVPQTDVQVEQAGEDSQVSQASLEAPETSQSSRLHDLEKAGAGTGARKVQLRFQPGATLKGRRRFLAWNGCGALKLMLPSPRPQRPGMRPGSRALKFEKSEGSQGGGHLGHMGHGAHVDVDYYRRKDKSSVRSFKIEENVELGAIGPDLFALVSNACGNSTVVVHVASPWQQACFRHTLDSSERAEALALSSYFVAVVVSPQRFLRIYTPSFVPIGVVSLAGDVVSMVAHEDLLLVVYQRKPRREPNLRYMILNVVRKEKLHTGLLPLSPWSTLKWIGFSIEAQPLSLDSQGVLRMLALGGSAAASAAASAAGSAAGFGGSWIPVAELGADNGLWPVQAEEGALSCVELASGLEPKAGSSYRFKVLPFKLPLNDSSDSPFHGPDGPECFLRQGLLASHWAQATELGLLPKQKRGPSRQSALKLLQFFLDAKEEELAKDVAIHFLSEGKAVLAASESGDLAAQLTALTALTKRTKDSKGSTASGKATKFRKLG